jgi:hypothetical protein
VAQQTPSVRCTRARVGHERGTDFRLGENRLDLPVAEAMDRVVDVLDVRTADAEDVANVPVAQGRDERVDELHVWAGCQIAAAA